MADRADCTRTHSALYHCTRTHSALNVHHGLAAPAGTPAFNSTFFCDPGSVTGCYYHDKARTGTYATAAAACAVVGGGLVRYRSWVEQTMVEVGGGWGWG